MSGTFANTFNSMPLMTLVVVARSDSGDFKAITMSLSFSRSC
ncbi:MAG TPA: hypothetical protein DD407_01830 [Pseudohongiella sp.]|nr:hypothetical protein [Pseudohongiella sp.]